jgi:hypothetical protein
MAWNSLLLNADNGRVGDQGEGCGSWEFCGENEVFGADR